VIEAKQATNFPLDGRNSPALLPSTPGVVPIMRTEWRMSGQRPALALRVAIGSDYSFPAIMGDHRSDFFLLDGACNNYGAIERPMPLRRSSMPSRI